MTSQIFYLLDGVVLILVVYWALRFSRKPRAPLPPGPPDDPLIGHIRVIPPSHQEETFYQWGKQYGDVIYLRVPGRSLVVLNSMQSSIDLLEKRSGNYSDRPEFTTFELMGWTRSLIFMRYGDRFRKHRKLLQHFARQRCPDFLPIQSYHARVLLKNLLDRPTDHELPVRRFAASIILEILYGHRVTSNRDEYMNLMWTFLKSVEDLGQVGSSAVDFFPFLKHFPPWAPGTWFASRYLDGYARSRKIHDLPFDAVKDKMMGGTAEPSFLSSHIETFMQDGGLTEDNAEDLKGLATITWAAGDETVRTYLRICWSFLDCLIQTSTTIFTFILAMVLHPEVQKRAQEEIDTVIGGDRLPSFGDREALPYVECVLQEALRWHPAIPLGLPHRSLEDDVYKGMFIPKGSWVFANITGYRCRGMALDEAVYTNPRRFYPARFLPMPEGNGEPNLGAAFGFGRRVCPGRYLADSSVWIALASILATIDIGKTKGEDGQEITPELAFTSGGLTSHPESFKCTIRPRHRKAELLIVHALDTPSYPI